MCKKDCAIIDCPAPPAGCEYTDMTYDENQCMLSCGTLVCTPKCGDGNLDAGEQCDDGNKNNGDGCDSVCQIEVACKDVTCSPAPTGCHYENEVHQDGCKIECGDLVCPPPPSGEKCGDNICNNGEDCSTCSRDC